MHSKMHYNDFHVLIRFTNCLVRRDLGNLRKVSTLSSSATFLLPRSANTHRLPGIISYHLRQSQPFQHSDPFWSSAAWVACPCRSTKRTTLPYVDNYTPFTHTSQYTQVNTYSTRIEQLPVSRWPCCGRTMAILTFNQRSWTKAELPTESSLRRINFSNGNFSTKHRCVAKMGSKSVNNPQCRHSGVMQLCIPGMPLIHISDPHSRKSNVSCYQIVRLMHPHVPSYSCCIVSKRNIISISYQYVFISIYLNYLAIF
jgi:hypothetical protein